MSGVDLGAMRSRWAAIVDDEERISFEAWTRRIYDFAKDALAALEEPAEPCKKCGYAGGCMEPWAAVSLDDPGDKVLIPCGTCPACLGAPGGES